MSESRTIYEGITIDVALEQASYPDGRSGTLEVIKHPGGAAVVAIDDEQRICLIRQYRHIAGGWIWELPAGRIDPGETPESTAPRELLEETGLVAKHWEPLGPILSSPGVFSEVLYLYLATGLEERAPDRHEDEYIEVHRVSLSQAIEWAHVGEINDAKTVIGILRAARRMGVTG